MKTRSNPHKNKPKKHNISAIMPPSDALSRNKIFIFRIIAILFAFIILFLIEIILRISGYGHDLHLFIESKSDKSCWVMNPYASDKYFTDSENATVGNLEQFKKHKSQGTFRIFVLGESTTIGFPYLHNGSFHRWLQYRLMHTFEDKDIEIINVSLTAVSSYTVLGFGKEILKYEPDAVLIYAGHNEYYGALGIGSTSHLGNNPFLIHTILKLRDFRIIQLIANTLSGSSDKKFKNNEGLMTRMVADQKIILGSRKYELGIQQFNRNMNEVCQMFSERKIPVFLSNLVSNEKDLKPFISDSTDTAYSAMFQFQNAVRAYNNGDFVNAKKLFVKSKELDLLRFRAPEKLNNILDEISKKYPGIYLVDTKSVFEQHSPHGILGEETLLEHVHPNLYGYALLSDAFYQAMKQDKIIDATWKDQISLNQLLEQMPVTKIDSLKGLYLISCMKKAWPYNLKNQDFKWGTSVEDSIAAEMATEKISWKDAMIELLNYYKNTDNLEGGLKISEGMILEYPFVLQNYLVAASYCEKFEKFGMAVVYLKKAFRLKPDISVAGKIVATELELDKPEATIPFLDYMISSNHVKNNLPAIKNTMMGIVKLKHQLLTDSSNINILNQLAVCYLRIGRAKDATKFNNLSLVENRADKKSLEIADKIKQYTTAMKSKQ